MVEKAPLIKSKFRTVQLNAFAYRSFRGFISEQVKVSDVFASCATCRSFDAPRYFCKKYNQHPPVEVIVNSCIIGYDDRDEIPY